MAKVKTEWMVCSLSTSLMQVFQPLEWPVRATHHTSGNRSPRIKAGRICGWFSAGG